MRLLVDEKKEYELLMERIDMVIIDCFNHKAPCTFIKAPKGFDKA